MSVFKTFLVIFAFSPVLNTLNLYGPTVINDYTNCINDIVGKAFTKNGLLIFANSKNVSHSILRIRDDLLKTVNVQIKYSVEIVSPNTEVDICDLDNSNLGILHVDYFYPVQAADYFVIIIDTYKDFSYLSSKLIRSRSWNPYAEFIILLLNFANTDLNNIKYTEKILTCLFKYNAINVIVIVPKIKQYRHATIYSWKPYDPPKHCGYYNETAINRLEIVNTCENGKLKRETRIFQKKIPGDMKHCVLNIIALQRQPFISKTENDANIEKALMNQVLKRYKITPQYDVINEFRGEREDIGQWNGALKQLATKKGDVLLGGIFPDFDVHEDFECSTTYLSDAYTWVVPRAPKLPPWVSLIIIFKSHVWYSAIGSFFICAISLKIIGQISKDSRHSSTLDHCFLNTWVMMLGFVAYIRPHTRSLRVFYIFLNLYCILFLTAYQTKLFAVLTNPSFEDQIKNVEELIESGLKIGGFPELHDIFADSLDPFDKLISTQWINIDNITKAMIDVAVHRNFSVLCSRLELGHISAILPELSDTSGEYKYYAFTENTYSVAIETIALKGFPFMKEFSSTLRLFKQAGVNDLTRKIFKHFNALRRARLLRSLFKEKSDFHPLSLQHLQGGFLALAIGFVGGTFTLIIEIVIHSNYFQSRLSKNK